MEVTISQDRRIKIRDTLIKMRLLQWTTIQELESVIGKLSFCAILLWPGNAFLRRLRTLLYDYIKVFGRKQVYVELPNWALKDIQWWIRYITILKGVSIISLVLPPPPNREMGFDGATNGSRKTGWCPGLGVVFENEMIMDKILDKFLGVYRNTAQNYEKKYAIVHFEMLAILVGLHNFREKLREGDHIMLWTDNKTVEAILKTKSPEDLFLQSGIRWVCMFAVETNTRFYINYINTKSNKLPDALSRFNKADVKRINIKQQKQRTYKSNIKYPNINKW